MENTLLCTCTYDYHTCKRRAKLEQLREELDDMLKFLGQGWSRRTYVHPNGDFVIKIPKACGSLYINEREADRVEQAMWPAPKTHLEYYEGIPVIHMERIFCAETPNGDGEDARASRKLRLMRGEADFAQKYGWVDCVDASQVGFTKDNRLVAFDLG